MIRDLKVWTFGTILMLAMTLPGSAQNAADKEAGLKLAEEVCARCHGVRKGYEPSPEPFAPSFEAIANTRGMSELAISVFLRTPHANMPNLILSDDEVANVSAYIAGLKGE